MIVNSCLDPSSAKIDELKRENNFLKDYVIRLNASISELQTENPPKSLEKENRVCHSTTVLVFQRVSNNLLEIVQEAVRRMKSLPSRGPMPSWLVSCLRSKLVSSSNDEPFLFRSMEKLNRRYLAPLFLFYDEKILDQHNEITRFQVNIRKDVRSICFSKEFSSQEELAQIKSQVKDILDENSDLHRRLSSAGGTSSKGNDGLSDLYVNRQRLCQAFESTENKQ